MAKIVLTTQEVNEGWAFQRLELTLDRLSILVQDDLSRRRRIDYTGVEAEAFLATVDTADFSGPNPTLVETILQKLVDDGHFDGSVE